MTVASARALYRRAFGADPACVSSAPGRVNLIGEHTDYNGGDVLPMGLHLRTAVAVGMGTGDVARAVSLQESEVASFDVQAPARTGGWSDYLAGTAWAMRSLGVDVPIFQAAVASEVPVGAGLSSSAALEVATAAGLAALSGRGDLTSLQLARAAHAAESQFVGVPCGIMDQFACALSREGHALWLACDREDIAHVPFGASVLVFDSAIPRQLRVSAYATRREECDRALAAVRRIDPSVVHLARASEDVLARAEMGDVERRRARHVIRETQRVASFVDAMRRGEPIDRVGHVLLESHASLRDDYECSTAALDWFVTEASQMPGVYGARLTGAGWGGCAIAVGTEGALRAAAESIPPRYEAQFGHRARCWISRASRGVSVS
ncbi:MAG: galactokinase [Gemmatimonadaceae bacterium]